MPTANPLNAPLSLSIITLIIIGGGFYLSLRITKNKRRGALWIETILMPVVLLSLYLAYDPFTVGIIAGITVAIWFITAIASPKRKGAGLFIDDSNYPCSGCKRVLKIVE